ncbi:hypothetical protein KFK09_007075 [Dendrobium nobile]|uniref:Zinc finger, CCHC-type n=1 Tax=Dendrobium nobile TaxID=94219 RepID=A0A8T3BVF7_DENNO|nr:hypothetical protein KFK09_007075 [Dendrobium nobile]
MITAYEIMESLQSMFGQPSEQAHHEAIKAVMNSKMKANVSVREHVLKMINYIHEAEINGAIIDEGTQVGMILETLSSRFLHLKSNYFMNRLKYNLTELLNELQTFESISKEKEPESNVAEDPMEVWDNIETIPLDTHISDQEANLVTPPLLESHTIPQKDRVVVQNIEGDPIVYDSLAMKEVARIKGMVNDLHNEGNGDDLVQKQRALNHTNGEESNNEEGGKDNHMKEGEFVPNKDVSQIGNPEDGCAALHKASMFIFPYHSKHGWKGFLTMIGICSSLFFLQALWTEDLGV